MDGINKTNCAYALDGTCKLPDTACENCKVDWESSELHKTLICGLTWDELMAMQQKKRGEK